LDLAIKNRVTIAILRRVRVKHRLSSSTDWADVVRTESWLCLWCAVFDGQRECLLRRSPYEAGPVPVIAAVIRQQCSSGTMQHCPWDLFNAQCFMSLYWTATVTKLACNRRHYWNAFVVRRFPFTFKLSSCPRVELSAWERWNCITVEPCRRTVNKWNILVETFRWKTRNSAIAEGPRQWHITVSSVTNYNTPSQPTWETCLRATESVPVHHIIIIILGGKPVS